MKEKDFEQRGRISPVTTSKNTEPPFYYIVYTPDKEIKLTQTLIEATELAGLVIPNNQDIGEE